MRALQNINHKLSLRRGAPEPVRQEGEVKVQIHYASLNPTDADIARGDLDLFIKLARARSSVHTGLEFSGTVAEGSAKFPTGTKVFGYTHLMKGPKTHQDVVSIPESFIAKMPKNLSFSQAAAFPLGAQTSLVALRDIAQLKRGQSVLILGASGGLGVYAIQLARHMQLAITGVSGPDGLNLMKELGADEVVNYRRTSIDQMINQFDVVLELSNQYLFRDVRHLLKPHGTFVPTNPQKNLLAIAGNKFRRQKVGYLFVDRGDSTLLTELAGQIAQGVLSVGPVREFDFEDFEQAFASLQQPGQLGRTVLRLR